MKAKINAEVGVIVARLQVPELHQAHKELIQSVVENHSKVVIFLGLSPCKTTFNNPLDFEARKQMVLQAFPSVNVLYIKDHPSDEQWSRNLDGQIEDILGPSQKAVLYGSRDSFLKCYTGRFPTIELEPIRYISGTELRKEVSNRVKANSDFRAGVIWAVGNQFPACISTVDIVIIDPDRYRFLVAKKPTETQYRFVGGFTNPNSDSNEVDAARETREETGLEVGPMVYLGSAKINDWRYRSEQNKIRTSFFATKYIFGAPTAADDISEVCWWSLDQLEKPLVDQLKQNIVPEHHVLVDMLAKSLNNGLIQTLNGK